MKKIDEVKNIRFVELDSLRGIAVILVLLSHYTWAYDYHFGSLEEHFFHFIYGGFGVQIFFMISGFVIFMTLDKSNTVKHFAISRFTRLYPIYWTSIFITVSIIFLFPVPTFAEYTLTEIIANFTMLQSFLKIRHIDQVYWSLGIELIFYIIMGIVFYKNSLHKIEFLSIIWLTIVSIILLVDFPFKNYIHALLITDWAPLFIAGMMFYKIKYKTSSSLTHTIIGISLIVFMISLYLQLIKSNQVEVSIIHFLLIIFAYIVFYLLMYFNIKILRNKYLIFLGSISYALYLLHNVIGYTLIYRLKMTYDNQFFYVSITTGITILLAYLVTSSIEPISRQLRKKLDKRF